MATDYVTTPNTFLGNVIYFAILGLVTTGLRVATGMEVVSFAILLMNLFVPLIDKFVYPKPFGYTKAKKS
jgi:electron transport complex protein RnfD